MVPCSCSTHTGFWQTLFTSSCISPSKHFLFLCSPLQDSETKGMFGWSKSIRCSAVSAQLAYGGVFCCFPQSLIFSNIYGLYRRITLTARRERVCEPHTWLLKQSGTHQQAQEIWKHNIARSIFWVSLASPLHFPHFCTELKMLLVFLSWFRFK